MPETRLCIRCQNYVTGKGLCESMRSVVDHSFVPCSVARGGSPDYERKLYVVQEGFPLVVQHESSSPSKHWTISVDHCGPQGHWYKD